MCLIFDTFQSASQIFPPRDPGSSILNSPPHALRQTLEQQLQRACEQGKLKQCNGKGWLN